MLPSWSEATQVVEDNLEEEGTLNNDLAVHVNRCKTRLYTDGPLEERCGGVRLKEKWTGSPGGTPPVNQPPPLPMQRGVTDPRAKVQHWSENGYSIYLSLSLSLSLSLPGLGVGAGQALPPACERAPACPGRFLDTSTADHPL